MTLEEIINSAAAYLHRESNDLIVNNVDLGLVALNHVRRLAEQTNDFNFTKKLVTIDVNGFTGGSLDEAVEYGTTDPVILVKTVVDVGILDVEGRIRPVEWTTTSDSFNRQRQDNPHYVPRFPNDAQAVCGPIGQQRFQFSGQKVYYFPRTQNLTIPLAIDVYTFTPDWTNDDVKCNATAAYNGVWTQRGDVYLMWATVVHLNNLWRDFVFRQEGNLPPPEKLAETALDALMRWDTFQYEQFRRHSR